MKVDLHCRNSENHELRPRPAIFKHWLTFFFHICLQKIFCLFSFLRLKYLFGMLFRPFGNFAMSSCQLTVLYQKWKILNMVLDVYKSHDISLHLNWKDVSTVLWSCSGTGVRELSKFKWAFTNFFKLAQTKRPSKWQLEWILGRLGPGQLGPVHFVKIHKWQFLWNIKLDCYLGSLSGPEGGGHNF